MNKKEYLEKVKLLKEYAKAYYIDDNPLVADEVYDKLYKLVEEFENQNKDLIDEDSPTQRVGGILIDKFFKASHLSRMWSLEDVFNNEELETWIERVQKIGNKLTFYVEPKFDGASLNLIYENGKLKQAITRGDGEIGEDVTENAKVMKSIPLNINYKDLIEIRGEAVIKKDDFEKVNQERLANNEYLFANPRNASAGGLRQFDTNKTAKRKLIFLPWGVGVNNLKIENSSELMEFIYDLGFKKPPMKGVFENITGIEKIYKEMIKNRDSIEMMLDGMVIKIDNIAIQDELGFTVKNPKWACAYKFPAIEKQTKILSISLQVGRTGVVTPVANVEPVNIEGALIERATLHNFEDIERKGVKIGDTVIIIRSGDVIPKIIKPLENFRDGTEIEIKRPVNCPTCESELFNDGTFMRCQNLSCSARVINSIIHFAGKKAMYIDSLGDKIIEQLYNNNLIKDISDLYNLERDKLVELDGFQEKKADRILNSIDKSKNQDLWRLLNGLGIEHIGEVASKKIADSFGLEI